MSKASTPSWPRRLPRIVVAIFAHFRFWVFVRLGLPSCNVCELTLAGAPLEGAPLCVSAVTTPTVSSALLAYGRMNRLLHVFGIIGLCAVTPFYRGSDQNKYCATMLQRSQQTILLNCATERQPPSRAIEICRRAATLRLCPLFEYRAPTLSTGVRRKGELPCANRSSER